MIRPLIVVLAILLTPMTQALAADDGLIKKKSNHSVSKTLDRLEDVLKKKGITVALRWNHAERAKGAGIPLRDTELLIFGNPKLGSHMFTANQQSGIDFPMKALAWEDKDGTVWLSYNDPAFFAKRHNITNRDEILKKMTGALNNLTNAAIAK